MGDFHLVIWFLPISFCAGWSGFDGLIVLLLGVGAKGIGVGWKASNVKIILNGGESVTFVRPDGYFSLYPIY